MTAAYVATPWTDELNRLAAPARPTFEAGSSPKTKVYRSGIANGTCRKHPKSFEDGCPRCESIIDERVNQLSMRHLRDMEILQRSYR